MPDEFQPENFAEADKANCISLAELGKTEEFVAGSVEAAHVLIRELVKSRMYARSEIAGEELEPSSSGAFPETARKRSVKEALSGGTSTSHKRFISKDLLGGSEAITYPPVKIVAIMEADPILAINPKSISRSLAALNFCMSLNRTETFQTVLDTDWDFKVTMDVYLAGIRTAGVALRRYPITPNIEPYSPEGRLLMEEYIDMLYDTTGEVHSHSLISTGIEDVASFIGGKIVEERRKGIVPLVVAGLTEHIDKDPKRTYHSEHSLLNVPRPLIYVQLNEWGGEPFVLRY